MRNLLTVFFLLMLATLSLGGCIRAPLPPVSDFYQDGYGNTLLSEEKVLQYRENYGDVIALTDERILYNTGPRDGSWRPSYPNESVDLANIRKIAWQTKYRNIDFIHLDLYGELGTVNINYPWDDERITQAIQAQVDYINTIRNELGISIPESVTTSELNKINKPVIAELRERRKKAAYTTSHRLEKDASTQNECPDITGMYYGRSVYSFKSYPSDEGYVNSMDEPLCPENNNDWMPSHCSLTNWLDHMASGLSNDVRDPDSEISSCPPDRVIELVSENVLKKITVITYRDDVVLNKFTIDSESMGYRCEKDRIILYENKTGAGLVRDKITMYKSDDGSINISHIEGQGIYPLLPILINTGTSYRWGKVENTSNPYKGCPEVQP